MDFLNKVLACHRYYACGAAVLITFPSLIAYVVVGSISKCSRFMLGPTYLYSASFVICVRNLSWFFLSSRMSSFMPLKMQRMSSLMLIKIEFIHEMGAHSTMGTCISFPVVGSSTYSPLGMERLNVIASS